jgi:hypothetical protein
MIATNHDPASGGEASRDAQIRPARRGPRARPLLLGMMLGLFVVVGVATVVLLATRRSITRLTAEAYQQALDLWAKNGPQDYELDLELGGNRPGKIHVEVRGGEVVHMTRDGVEPSQKRTWDYWSVPGQLETIGQELEMARDPAGSFKVPGATQMVMWAEFDPQYGYPRQYDRVVLGADFEVHWKVTRFQPLRSNGDGTAQP